MKNKALSINEFYDMYSKNIEQICRKYNYNENISHLVSFMIILFLVNYDSKYERIIIYDSTSTYNGYSSYLISQIMLQKGDANVQVEAYALKNEFVKHAKISEQLIDQGLDCDSFYNKIHD